ncbi:interleukin-1 receptor-like 1 [Antennarius striatus]|uniref:interleukin-1 receptor-like 1 n=1 Tax=Antennarius striatus TaxID=241820 RepID=UPI0035B364E4
MDSSWFLLFIIMAMIPSECSEEARCHVCDVESFNLLEGEAFHFEPKCLLRGAQVTWYKNDSRMEQISMDKNESVHFHDPSLFFLNLSSKNSGLYTARYQGASKCRNISLKITVFENRTDEALLYGKIKNSDVNKKVKCPEAVKYTCTKLGGNFTWMKDFELLPGYTDANLWIDNATKNDKGIYTCVCTWTYNRKEYRSSGSRRLIYEKQIIHLGPVFIAPTDSEQFADEALPVKLNCSVLCGTNAEPHCKASWNIDQTSGHSQTTEMVTDSQSGNTISTAVLSIEKVTAKDFQTDFKCIGEGYYKIFNRTVTLKRRGSIIPLVVRGLCVLSVCVLGALVVKCFSIDLVLFFRPYFPPKNQNKDGKVYDAYVVFQMQSMSVATEDTLCRFITNAMPSVLEKKCGYKLFIHGRDDLPGEDSVELVEDRIKKSRRLMVILPLDSEPGSDDTEPQISAGGSFAWQMGLHHVLVQRDMGVILIQLGHVGPGGYSNLSPGLQHLIRRSAPLRWSEGSRDASTRNSRFWKRVRYLMPAAPAQRCPASAVI